MAPKWRPSNSDDFTIEVVYAGIAEMLRESAVSRAIVATISGDLPPEARQERREDPEQDPRLNRRTGGPQPLVRAL